MPKGRWIARGLPVAVVVGLIVAEIATSGSGGASGQGRPAPALPKEVLNGPAVTLASLRGKPAFVNFWASWCTPCKQEAPELERFSKAIHGQANLVGVDWNDTADNARAFIASEHLSYPILRDGSNEVGDAYRLSGLPTTFVLDPAGRIVETLRGPQTFAGLMDALRAVRATGT